MKPIAPQSPHGDTYDNNHEAFQRAKAAVVTVGGGRGFVIERGSRRFIITAAHCLLKGDSELLPFPAIGAVLTVEHTCRNLLAPLGAEPAIWAECLFADPIGDIAVLGEPDGQNLWEQHKAYDELVQAATPIAISDAPEGGPAWMLSLDGNWFSCTVTDLSGFGLEVAAPLWLSNAANGIRGGMSGSPIISADGLAIGIVCLSNGYDADGDAEICTEGGPNPRLVDRLPGWLLSDGPKKGGDDKIEEERLRTMIGQIVSDLSSLEKSDDPAELLRFMNKKIETSSGNFATRIDIINWVAELDNDTNAPMPLRKPVARFLNALRPPYAPRTYRDVAEQLGHAYLWLSGRQRKALQDWNGGKPRQ